MNDWNSNDLEVKRDKPSRAALSVEDAERLEKLDLKWGELVENCDDSKKYCRVVYARLRSRLYNWNTNIIECDR